MFKFITGKIGNRFTAMGMVTLLFVAGLAFAVLENTAGPRLMPAIGLAEGDEAPVDVVDPRLDPDDCLFDPEAFKELAEGAHGTTGQGIVDPGVPVDHPGASGTPRAIPGDAGDTGSAGSPTGSLVGPGGSSGDPDDAPPGGGTDGEAGVRPAAPHDRGSRETDCPGLQ